MNNLKHEERYPLIVASVFALTISVIVYFGEFKPPKTTGIFLNAVVSFSGVSVGFLAMIQSILITLKDGKTIRFLKKINVYSRVTAYLRKAFVWFLILTLFSSVLLLVNFDNVPMHLFSMFIVLSWSFTFLCSFLCGYRIFKIFHEILEADEFSKTRV